MIRSFKCSEAEGIFRGESSRRFKAIEKTAIRRLFQLDQVRELRDLSAIPALRLEALRGDRKGQYSIRVSDQYRICFTWNEGDVLNVEIVDYH